MNKTSVDRGLFHITAYKTMTASEKTLSPNERTMFANPIRMREQGKKMEGGKHANYQLLDDRGVVKEESYIPRGQEAVVLGMVHVRQHVRDQKKGVFTEQVIEETYHDVSIRTDGHHYGKVDRVFVATQNQGVASRIAKVRFRKVRRPELGDKHCLTPDHEVLTTEGWKHIEKITTHDDVYVLKSDGSFGYEKPYSL
jgi:DNA-directed RNA polymerase beta subunit